MKKLFLTAALFLTTILSFATVINVANPGNGNDIYANIQTALASANDGDQLVIPTGTFILSGRTTITEFISLKGTDTTNTILYRSDATSDATVLGWESMFRYAINSNRRSRIIIEGITFKSKTPSVATGDGLSTVRDIAVNMVNAVDWVIRDCKFMWFGNAAVQIEHRNRFTRSLIHDCNFVHNQKGDGLGYGYSVNVNGSGLPDVWITDPAYGTWNSNFVENCKFLEARHAIASSGGGLYVFRYNIIRNNWINNPAESYTHAIDTHTSRKTPDANYYGTRMVEIYNNTIINSVFDDGTAIVAGQNASRLVELCIAIRSGEGVCYNNSISGFQYGVGIYADDVSFGSTYPIRYGPGYTSGARKGSLHTGTSSYSASGDWFIWNNTFVTGATLGLTGTTGAFLNYNVPAGAFAVNRDYHLSAKPGYVAAPYPHYLLR